MGFLKRLLANRYVRWPWYPSAEAFFSLLWNNAFLVALGQCGCPVSFSCAVKKLEQTP